MSEEVSRIAALYLPHRQSEGNVSRKVLIVDDSKLARMAVVRVLSGLHPDWSTEEAANADQALASFKQSPPDFVLLDFNMPGKDGLALAAELRDLNPEVAVAVISANHQVEVVNRAQAAGAMFLPKPLTEKALIDFLARVRSGKVLA
jgi:CheY-like chemotaxis protein